MKKTLLAAGLALTFAVPFGANAADYVIDTKGAHSSVNFKVSHLGYGFIKGRFNNFDGEFYYDPSDIAASKINVVVDTTSLDSNHAERDKHLRSSDFIDASKFGTATFTSTKVVDQGDGNLEVTGDMTLYGQTKPVIVKAAFIGAGKDPWGGERAGFMGTTRLELKEFGVPTMGPATYADMEFYVEGVKK